MNHNLFRVGIIPAQLSAGEKSNERKSEYRSRNPEHLTSERPPAHRGLARRMNAKLPSVNGRYCFIFSQKTNNFFTMKSMKDMKFKKVKNQRLILLSSCPSCPSWLIFLPFFTGDLLTSERPPAHKGLLPGRRTFKPWTLNTTCSDDAIGRFSAAR